MADTFDSSQLNGLVINEFLVDPNSTTNQTDTDGNGTANGRDEYIEFYNGSPDAIDISGLQLWDAGRGNWFTFPDGSILPAGGLAVVVRDAADGATQPAAGPNVLVFDANFGSNVLNNGGDNITLLDPVSNQYIQATYGGDTLDTPETDYAGFPSDATRAGTGEDFGEDVDGLSIQRTGDGGDEFTASETSTPGTMNYICFAGSTLIATPNGPRAIKTLGVGDLVLTADNGAQPIRWIGKRHVKITSPNAAPVQIEHGALGPNRPNRRLIVSQNHRIGVTDATGRQHLSAAKHLIDRTGISIDRTRTEITYVHILLDAHHLINAHGTWAESLYLGRETARALTPSARAEILALFPELTRSKPRALARPELNARTTAALLDRANLA